MEALRERLDATDPRDFAAVVEQWAALRGATWRGGL
jgi:hypothetical protein